MTHLVPLFDSAATTWFSFVYHVSWQASLLAVLLLVIVRLGRRWSSPLRYWLLVLALAKFALPPLVSLPTGLFSQVGPAVSPAPVVADLPKFSPPVSDLSKSLAAVPEFSAVPAPIVAEAEQTMPVAEIPLVSPALDSRAWLMLVHFAGVLVVCVWIAMSLRTMRSTVRRAQAVYGGDLRRRFVALSERFGLRQPPRLLLSSEPCGPVAFGMLRPVVVLPEAVTSLDGSALDAILAHELAHHSRRDPWINWIQLALTALWWFNPVVWILNREIRRVREDCCDDLLLNRQLTTGEAYCDTLLNAATRITGRATASVALGFGGSLHPLGRRFERIMDQTLRRAPRLSLAGFLLLTVLACVVLPGLRRSVSDESKSPSTSSESTALKLPDATNEKAFVEERAATPSNDRLSADSLAAADAKDVPPAKNADWPEGATVTGRVLNHRGEPVANAEVLLLGKERIIVDAETRKWFVPENQSLRLATVRTDKTGAFTITRKQGTSNRLAIIAEDPLFWVVPRKSLEKADNLEIKLPESGILAVHCEFPRKAPKLPVMIELKSFDGATWNTDSLRFHMSVYTLRNPGETVFEHLPPGHYAVQRYEESKNGANSVLITGADRQIVRVESEKRAGIAFDRLSGLPLSGRVRGLENVELRYARVTINHLGPEEVLGNDGKLNRMYVAFDVLPVTSEGGFTTDPIPPGKFAASLFAVLASTPQLSSQSADYVGDISFTVPEAGEPPKVELVAKRNRPRDLSQVTDLRVRVVDEEGKPVPKLESMVHTADQGYGAWTAGGSGLAILGGAHEYRGAALQVLVRAEGYASAVARYEVAERDKLSKGEATITLRRGRKVTLEFQTPEGMTWPKGTLPELYFDEMQERVRVMRQPTNRRSGNGLDFNMLNLREAGPGRFEFRLADDTPRFHVSVHAPGFLQCFETGPFTPAELPNESFAIKLPVPAAFDLSFEPGDYPGAATLFKNAFLDVHWRLEGNSFITLASAADPALKPVLKVTDLAPGDYMVSLRTQPAEESPPLPETRINPGMYYDQRKLTLKEGQSVRIAFRSTPYDPAASRGNRRAVVRIRTPDGKPAKGRNASILYSDGHYGAQSVFTGTVPDSGDIVLTGITDKPGELSLPPYRVLIDDRSLGSFSFADDPTNETFDFVLAPQAGDRAPDVELTNLATGKPTSLSSFRGKVLFVEFWATWCGPCQPPMSALHTLAAANRDAWKDQLVIVPISIDGDRARLEKHVKQRGWTALDHYWSGGGKHSDFEASAARAFVVQGVPEAMLIGKDGRILWRGHPSDETDGKDLKTRIEQALK